MQLRTMPRNALTVDVEDYFHVEAFRSRVDATPWDDYPERVVANTRRLLDIFDKHEVKATFFTLGWVAHRHPKLVADIAARGHEIACHSYWHRLIYTLEPQEFRRDTREATAILEDAAGCRILGYRAPTYSITRESLWALEILAEEGYAYDSSVFPIRHDYYGIADFPRAPVQVERRDGEPALVEFPPCTTRFCGQNLPGPGGGYLRIFPLWYSMWVLRRLVKEGLPGTVYLHPWEIDPQQPRLSGPWKSRFRHYTGLRRTAAKLERLLETFEFAPMRDVLRASPPAQRWRLPELKPELVTEK